MNKQALNTFIKGLNVDIDKSVISKDSYLDAHNFRIVTSEGASSGAFENIKGNKLIGQNYVTSAGVIVVSSEYLVVLEPVTYNGTVYHVGDIFVGAGGFAAFTGAGKVLDLTNTKLLPKGQLVCGATKLRDDYIILFTTNNTSTPVHGTGRSTIYKLILNKVTEEVTSLTLQYDDSLNTGAGTDTLDFSTVNKIKGIARYETPNIQKVYWTDGYNNLRYANFAKNLTITGAAYPTSNYMLTSMFEFLPAFTPSRPTLVDIVGGNLMTGMVQYSYQLYRLNGAETAFSPVSDMIHIVSDSDFASNTLVYKGDGESVASGKGCQLTIHNDDAGYDRLRLVRIHYSTLNSIPVIAVCNEIEISTTASTDVTITDVGDTVSSLTLDEFNISSTELFKCEDIASKDNRLFAANITKSEFELDDFDVRAVRFRNVGAVVSSTVYDGVDALLIDQPAGDTQAEWDTAHWDDYILTHDGINDYNDAVTNDGDANHEYKFQKDGITFGAEGPNIKIDFDTYDVLLDTSNNDASFYTTSPSGGSDLSYRNYASPWKDGKLSWQRDEVYRLFVVFGNDRGQTADPKWMCDLRMPSFHENTIDNSVGADQYPSLLAYKSVTDVGTCVLCPRVYFKNWPATASWAQIHRVKRERADRSVVTQGFAVPLQFDVDTYSPELCSAVLPNGGEMFKLVSPEININKNISLRAGDYIEYVTSFTGGANHVQTDEGSGATDGVIYKMLSNAANRVVYVAATRSGIDDATMVTPSSSYTSNVITLDGLKFSNYNTDAGVDSKGCSGLLIAYSDGAWSAETVDNVIVNYKSDVYGSQYGGHTYEDRMLNITIPCSDIITAAGSWINVYYGDTFINYFDVSTLLGDLSAVLVDDTYAETLYVPLESSINCDLQHSLEPRHVFPLSHIQGCIRQEYAGEHELSGGAIFNQTTDLYLYNTVYSQQTSAQYGISTIMDVPDETVFDCLVKASNVKYNGELSDSWTKFNINEEIEVDANYGEIRAINTVNDKLLYWQADAFGILSVNTRSLIQDASSAQLALGTGGVLDRYDYISSTVGILNKSALVNSDNSVYWFYDKDHSIYKFDNKLINLAKNKGVWSWFNTNYTPTTLVHGVYDRAYNEVLFTLFDSVSSGHTLAFNEQTDQFTGVYDFAPYMYIDYKDGYLSTKLHTGVHQTSNYDLLFMHNSNINPRCRFYSLLAFGDTDTLHTFASTIKILYNQDYPMTKVFDNIFYISNAYHETTDIEQYGTTFDRVRCYNDYQNSDWVTLTYPTNIMRRDRGWALAVPRNLVDHNYTTSPDIFTDLAATKTWSERIRDKHMVLDLSFNNTSLTRFVIPYIGIAYRLSAR